MRNGYREKKEKRREREREQEDFFLNKSSRVKEMERVF
jgi:hypothetical protein